MSEKGAGLGCLLIPSFLIAGERKIGSKTHEKMWVWSIGVIVVLVTSRKLSRGSCF